MSFLSGLPVYDESRFSATNGEGGSSRQVLITAPVYTPTSSASLPPTDQIIVTEKSNILLKHLERLAQQKVHSPFKKQTKRNKKEQKKNKQTNLPAKRELQTSFRFSLVVTSSKSIWFSPSAFFLSIYSPRLFHCLIPLPHTIPSPSPSASTPPTENQLSCFVD